MGLQQTALFGKCLLAHELSKFREKAATYHQPFDGNQLEHRGPAPDDKDLLVCISAEINVLPNHIHMNRVTSFSNTHRSILTNFANKMVAMHLGQPSVRVNELRKWGQTGKFWEGDTRWQVPTGKPLVGPLCVVVKHEGFGDMSGLLKCLWAMDLYALLIVGVMVALDKSILERLDEAGRRSGESLNTRESASMVKENRVLWLHRQNVGHDQR